MNPAATILIVEDDPALRRTLANILSAEGYVVLESDSGDSAIQQATRRPPDLAILDLGLPDIDGLQVLQRWRDWLPAPVLVLSGQADESQKIAAFDAGATDYLVKPFSSGELLARIRAALRQANRATTVKPSAIFATGDLQVDLSNRQVLLRNREIHLSVIEFKLIACLAKNAGRVLTQQSLLAEIWGPQNLKKNHYLRVYMTTLRRKIEDDPAEPKYLLTERGVGYRLAILSDP